MFLVRLTSDGEAEDKKWRKSGNAQPNFTLSFFKPVIPMKF